MATDSQSRQAAPGGESNGLGKATKRAWVVGGSLESWWSLGWALHQAGIELRPVAADADLAALGATAAEQGGVVVVDLAVGQERAFATIVRCRSGCAAAPIVAVAAAPSADLTRRLTEAGVSFVTNHPLDSLKFGAAIDQAMAVVKRGAAPSGTKPKILIVDDDADYRASVTMLLESQSYDVCCATSGQEGLTKAMAEKPDLIILDVMMENQWVGYEVSQTIKQQSGYEAVRAIPILMVSSIQETPEERFAHSDDPAGPCPDTYLTKPIDIPVFLEAVSALLTLMPRG